MDDQDWRRLQMTTKFKLGKVKNIKEVTSNQRGKGRVRMEKIDTDCKWIENTQEPVNKSRWNMDRVHIYVLYPIIKYFFEVHFSRSLSAHLCYTLRVAISMEPQSGKKSNPNELSQSDNPFIFNNLNVTCQAQPDDLSREGVFVVC